MKDIIKKVKSKICFIWNSGRKGKISIVGVVLVILIGLITCCSSSSDISMKSAQAYEEEARVKFEELIADDYESGLGTILAVYAEMEAELLKHNLQIHELTPTGVILLDRGSNSLIEIKENTAGELVYSAALITENDAANLWNTVMPIAKLKAIAEMEELKKAAAKHDAQQKVWAAQQQQRRKEQEQQQRAQEVENIHQQYNDFLSLYNDKDRHAYYSEFVSRNTLDDRQHPERWDAVKAKIEKAISLLGIQDPSDETCWDLLKKDVQENGWGNRKPFVIFKTIWL